jgi:hypothetical protein
VKRIVLAGVIACGTADVPPPVPPARPATRLVVEPAPPPPDAALAPPVADEIWLKGTTHVHAAPSGDSVTPVVDVVRWYEEHGYDFIVLTDHNRVSPAVSTEKLLVIPGIELTHNRKDCEPPGDESRNCRIHVNGLGVTAKPVNPAEKIEWTDYKDRDRVVLYERAFAKARELGASLVQINHPQYYWGMTGETLAAIAPKAQLVEIANQQFNKWNDGDPNHPSVESLWDAVLGAGLTLWGVATDDAHDYQADGGGKYPAGGGWVMVKTLRRDPSAILAALAAGRFYSSTGVSLSRAERVGDELVVDVTPGATGKHTITFIENGKTVATVNGLSAKHSIPRMGYIRAIVIRDDGKKAWVQPVRL